ncbi:peptidoglycan-binding protein [Streptosporangium soli]|nr:peptidoglycan-binding protein [Streptosporangium sp. KLBMP 9127]
MRIGWLAAGGVVVALAGTYLVMSNDDEAPAPPEKAATATAEIMRGDLVDTKAVDGRLAYDGERTIDATRAGTVTHVPAKGAVVGRGRALYGVDRDPIILMYGRLPLYRTLQQGVSDGPDVEQLERNLRALGHGAGLTVDDHFSWATTRAVRDWQDDRGLPETGAVTADQVVFLPARVRVAGTGVALGDRVAPGRRVLALTGTRKMVRVDLPADDQDLARKNAEVAVELPGGRRAKGKITRVGTVAVKAEDGTSTIEVDVTLSSLKQVGRLDQAPVTVRLESERVRKVLSVPVEALLALREGGFGVEVVADGGRRIAAVRTGAYGGGRVEISGEGLAAGMKVGVPFE